MADIGFENKLRKNEDEQREELADAIIEALDLPEGTTPDKLIEAVEEILKENTEVQESVVEATANELAGGKKLKNADGTETDNPMYLYAKKELKGLRGKQLNSAAEKLKTDPVMASLRSKQADSGVSVVVKKDDNAKPNPSEIMEV
jgi:alanyl-tRNA synthetase